MLRLLRSPKLKCSGVDHCFERIARTRVSVSWLVCSCAQDAVQGVQSGAEYCGRIVTDAVSCEFGFSFIQLFLLRLVRTVREVSFYLRSFPLPRSVGTVLRTLKEFSKIAKQNRSPRQFSKCPGPTGTSVTSSHSTKRKNLAPVAGTVSWSLRGRGPLSTAFSLPTTDRLILEHAAQGFRVPLTSAPASRPTSAVLGELEASLTFLSRGWADLPERRAGTQAKGSMSAARAVLDDVKLKGEAVGVLKAQSRKRQVVVDLARKAAGPDVIYSLQE